MLYENYQNRIRRIAAVLGGIVRFLPLILTLAVLSAVLLSLKGTVFGWSCSSQITYGESAGCKGYAFLSKIQYEYREEDGAWQEGVPRMPGAYRVRAVGNAAFGARRFGKEVPLVILPREITVGVANESILYGEEVVLSGKTANGEVLLCDKYSYRRLAFLPEGEAAALYEVTPDPAFVKVRDAEGNDVTAGYRISVRTAEIPITRLSVTVRIPDAVKVYDGTPLRSEQYEWAEGSLCEGDVPQAVFGDSITQAGTAENRPTFTILDGYGGDVTACYRITYIYGNLTVEKRPLTITTESAESLYSSVPQRFEDFTVDPGAGPIGGHTVVAFPALYFEDAGEYQNERRFRVSDQNGTDQTDNYEITVNAGTVRIRPLPLTVTTPSGEWVYDASLHSAPGLGARGLMAGDSMYLLQICEVTDVGEYENALPFVIRDVHGREVTDNYAIECRYGTLKITPATLSITTSDQTVAYDGATHTNLGYRALGLADGHHVQILRSTEFKDVGEYANAMEFTVRETGTGRDVTFNYEFDLTFGTLRVTPITAYLTTESGTWTYDGKAHKIASYELSGVLPLHSTAADFSPSVTHAGQKENVIPVKILDEEGMDVTHNYNIVAEYGVLTVEKRRISVQTESASFVYDGMAHACTDYTVISETGLVSGETLRITAASLITDVGTAPNTDPVWEIVGSMRENYEIEWSYGTLEILPRPISVKPADRSKTYDGMPLRADGWAYAQGNQKDIVVWHTLTAEYLGEQTEIGVSASALADVRIMDGDTDVTANYSVTLLPGVLRVVSGDAPEEKPGDGGTDLPGDDVFEDKDFADIRDNGDQSKITVGEVRSDYTGILYLKRKAYGDFRKVGWAPAPVYETLLPGGYNMNYLTSAALADLGLVAHTLAFRDMKLPLLPYGIALGVGAYEIPVGDTANGALSEFYDLEYYVWPENVNIEALRGRLGEYAPYEEAYRAFVYESYLSVDAETKAFMEALISREGFSASDPYIIKKIASHIRGAGKLNEDYDRALDRAENILIAFLSEYGEGSSHHFASAAVLLYRTLGIPARYVRGCITDTSADDFVEIALPLQAWAEVYIDGCGWIPVDVTGAPAGTQEDSSGTRGEIVIEPVYENKVFNGDPLLPSGTIKANGVLTELLAKGYTYRVSVSGEQTAVGRSESKITEFTLYDSTGRDVTAQYRTEYRSGLLEVLPNDKKTVRIYLSQLKKRYDGTALFFEPGDYTVEGIDRGDSLSLTLRISLTGVGALSLSELNADFDAYAEYSIKRNGVDVTDEYRLVFSEYDPLDPGWAPIRVDPRMLTLTAGSETKVFDGAPLTNTEVFVSVGSLAPGHRLVAQTEGLIIYPDDVPNKITHAVIYDENGVDVTANYRILRKDGTLTVLETK